ncbi:TPA: type III secretion system needle length determinant [Aeromonas hydrophila]|nr:type III secretion system needle length determinant [Aeromonas hydrophila]HAU4976634.1 type III secretion system needle length determinant [Aeromonas hydrophila]HAU4986026.1 type III secretion system needle length determinant [Aeromonas hydrophila]HAU4986496.1 type III secretion system needle length determinant [Aeromonas hydrophila]
MNRLTAPRADTKIACEQHSLQREANKADPAQQQRFEQALQLESASQKVRDQKRVLSRQEQERRSKLDAPQSNSKATNKEAELAERKLARPAPHAKAPYDKQEGGDWQESPLLPATSPQIPEGVSVPTTQQERETAQAEQSRRVPSDITSSHELLGAAEPETRDGIYENAADLPLTEVSNEILNRLQLSNSNKLQEPGELATRPEVSERLQTEDEPIELAPVASEEESFAQENFAGSAIRVPPLSATPGDLLLARVAPRVDHHELGQLLSRLAVDIHLELGRPERPPMLQLTLPALGALAIRIEHHQGLLQVEMLASEQGSQLLNQGRGELIDRLQRLYPGERVAVDLFTRGDSEQGSRQKRSIYDEWDTDA